MEIIQISVFMENKPGRLYAAMNILAENKINIRALSISDTTDFGILRIIVDKPELAYEKLKENGFTASITNVISVRMADRPGGLAEVLAVLKEHEINVEYMYAFLSKSEDNAMVVFKVRETEEAIERLKDAGFHVLTTEEVYNI